MFRCRAFTGPPPTKGKCNGGVSSAPVITADHCAQWHCDAERSEACLPQVCLCAFLHDHDRAKFPDDNADYFFADCSSVSAISSSFRTVFQFLPVNAIFSVRSTVAMGKVGRAMPFGK